MANEFIARKGLIVLANGAKITGSFETTGSSVFNGPVTTNNTTGSFTGSFKGDGSNLTGITATGLDIDNFGNDLTGINVSGTDKMILSDAGTEGRINISQLSVPLAGTGLEANAGTIRISADAAGAGLTGGAGSALAVGAGSGITVNANDVQLDTSSAHFTGGARATISSTDTAGASGINLRYNPTSGVISGSLVNSAVTVTAGSGLSGGGSVSLGSSTTVTLDTSSVHFLDGVKKELNTEGVVSSSVQIDVRNTTGIATIATTGSNTFIGSQTVFGNIFLSGSNRLVYNNTNNTSLLFGFYDGSTINGPYYQIFGNNYADATQRGSAEFVFDTRNGGGSGFNIAAFDGTTWTRRFRVSPTGVQVTGSFEVTSGGITGSILSTNGVVSSSAQVTALLPAGTVSSSGQVDVRNTTGIATIATTGSNTFTGIQNISNTTNSTNYTDGALIVQGGVGITKDVNISGSLTVTGLLTAVSTSIQYVTSSQLNIGLSRITVNDDDLVRFAGLSVVDSGSTYGTGSLLWDSLRNHWIYEADDQAYTSAILIAGPKNTGSLGSEVELITGRIPVASGGDHIDTNPALTPLRVEGTTLHIEGSAYVTGSVTASAFSGDGSNLTGIVTNLNITGSDGGTGTVSLKTQALTIDGTNGLTATVSGQTVTISGSDATTTTKGVASFTGSNFDVNGGVVSALPITFNGVPLNLGSAYGFGLQNITPQGATTADQLVLNGGAVIHGVLFTSASNTAVDTGTEVVATISTGSYDAAFFDYVVKKGSSYRAGTVTAVWEAGTSNVEFTDVSTNDIGNTAEVILSVDVLSATARLKATVSSNSWIVKTAVRAL